MKPKLPKLVEMLPPVRPCLKCGQEKRIASHGLCDRCRKTQERAEDRHALDPAFCQTERQDKGAAMLAQQLAIFKKARVLQVDRQIILARIVPYFGLSPDTVALPVRDLSGPPSTDSQHGWLDTDDIRPSIDEDAREE
jgi:hypothetical protein